MKEHLKWNVATLTINQANILLAVEHETVAANDCLARPLVNLIRKGLITFVDTEDRLVLALTDKGKRWLERAGAISKAYGAYSDLTVFSATESTPF